MPRIACLLALLLTAMHFPPCTAQDISQQELDDWFNDDSASRIAAVNEGQLKFLTKPPARPVHHHHNIITLTNTSLVDGWADLQQCHENLDKVPATQIVFREDRVRDLQIVSFSGIKKAWVEGASVQLQDIGPKARICLRLNSLVLLKNADGTYHVNNGPFMRRFLDGYYPMRVSMEVLLANTRLRFVDITPPQQPGFQVRISDKGVRFNVWFEGRLNTLIRFKTPTNH